MQGFQSILLITNDQRNDLKRQFSIDCDTNHIDRYEIKPEASIGIDDIRRLKEFAAHQPIIDTQKTIIIHSAHLLTKEAQNALLKILEEPPEYLQIILITPQPNTLVDTIVSRCQIVRSLEFQKTKPEEQSKVFSDLICLPPAKRLSHIPTTTKTLDGAIEYCELLLREARLLFLSNPTPITLKNYKMIVECRQQLGSNANPTLALSTIVLQFAS